MWALLLGCAAALATALPGLPLDFEVADGHWRLGADLPPAIAAAGAQPGWELVAVDDLAPGDVLAAQRAVADGPARDVRLRFEPGGTAPETILVLRRAPLVDVVPVGRVDLPGGFMAPPAGFAPTSDGDLAVIDAGGRWWALDPDGGALAEVPAGDAKDPGIPEVFWGLSDATWAIEGRKSVAAGPASWAREELRGAARLRTWKGEAGDHLVVPDVGGLDVLLVGWPRGTPALPVCDVRVPEGCLTGGRQILAELGERPGAREEGLRQLVAACDAGVSRGCFEAVAAEDPSTAERVAACVGGQASACTSVARERLDAAPDDPPDLVVGLLDLACETEGSGTLAERLRRVEDVGAGCALLAQAHDARKEPDRALLALDQACVVGRAESCEEASARRHDAFAARTVRECESPDVPIAPSCVELGRLLQAGPVASAKLDDFGAFLRGCQLGSADGCLALGDYVDRWGIENPRVVDAEKVLRESCAGGEQRACLGAAHLLVRHEPRSEAYGEALVLFDGACDAGLAAACVAGAEQRRIGQARKVEAPDQVTLWTAACDQSLAVGCAGLGERLAREKELDGAFSAWTRGCELGDAHTCSELGPLVEKPHDPPWSGEQSPDAYLQRGCEGGDPEGCFLLAEDDLPRTGEPSESTYVLLERSCAGDYGAGCAALAGVHLARQTSFDDEIAARHLDTACENGDYLSCRTLGTMYLRGKGVERDRVRAGELLERFRLNATRKLARIGLTFGVPNTAGGELELVAPIPVGPAISLAANGAWLPEAGAVLVLLRGEDKPEEAPDLRVLGATARLYPNHQARGIYGAAGITQIVASGGSIGRDETRLGWSGRVGIRNDSGATFTGVEFGIGQYGWVDLHDFDEDEDGRIPLIVPTLALTVGLAPF